MLDHISDKNHSVLFALSRTVQFPEFVKTASIHDTEDVKDLTSSAFADPINRRYPIDTPADTWLSNLYFSKYGKDQYSEVKQAVVADILQKAAQLWNIDLNFVEINSQKTASSFPTVTFRHLDTPLFSIQITKQTDLEKIAEDITHNYRKYTFDTRKQVARQLIKIAQDFKYNLGENWQTILEKTAAYGVGDEDTLTDALNKRKRYLQKNAEVCAKIDSAINSVKENCAQSGQKLIKPSVMEKIASFVDAIDRLTDLHTHPSFTRPVEQDIFRFTPTGLKTVKSTAIITDNHLFSTQKLAKNKDKVETFVKDVCGKNSIQELSNKELKDLNRILA